MLWNVLSLILLATSIMIVFSQPLATMVNIIPAFLFLFFICTKKWKSVFSGLTAIVMGCLITFVLVGWGDCSYYISHVIPESGAMSSGWDNASLAGWWHKLSAPGVINGKTVALFASASVTRAGYLLSTLFVIISFFLDHTGQWP